MKAMEKPPGGRWVSRLAPTPSGYLHLGNAFSFFLTWLIVRNLGGRLILRIDDVDAERSRVAYVDHIFATLERMGLDYDAGPSGTDDFLKNFSQIEKKGTYLDYLRKIPRENLFACDCSRRRIRQYAADGNYPGICRGKRLPQNERTALRILTDDNLDPVPIPSPFKSAGVNVSLSRKMKDFAVWRKSDLPCYQLVSVVEDHEWDVNLIVRGDDLIDSSAAQIFLAERMGLEGFGGKRFVHHALLKDDRGNKLSKSAKAPGIDVENMTIREVHRLVAERLGLDGKPDLPRYLLEEFVRKSPGKIFGGS